MPASVTFNAAETSRTIIFSAAQDQVDENSESVKLGFGTMPDPQVSAGNPNEVTLTITDDDTADIVISPASLTVGENDTASYTVKLATEPTVNVFVTITGPRGHGPGSQQDHPDLHGHELGRGPDRDGDGGRRRRRRQ